jgi:hypothetical protein
MSNAFKSGLYASDDLRTLHAAPDSRVDGTKRLMLARLDRHDDGFRAGGRRLALRSLPECGSGPKLDPGHDWFEAVDCFAFPPDGRVMSLAS